MEQNTMSKKLELTERELGALREAIVYTIKVIKAKSSAPDKTRAWCEVLEEVQKKLK